MRSPPSLFSLFSFFPTASAGWGGNLNCWLAVGIPCSLFPHLKSSVHTISYCQPLFPSCRLSAAWEVVLMRLIGPFPSPTIFSVNSLCQLEKELKIARSALASHSQVAGSDEAPGKRIMEPEVQLQELQVLIYWKPVCDFGSRRAIDTHMHTLSHCALTAHATAKHCRTSWKNQVPVVYLEADKQWLLGEAFLEEVKAKRVRGKDFFVADAI